MSSDRSGRVGLRPDERAAMLLTLLGQQPSASLAQMQEVTGASLPTLRRDLAALAEQGVIRRVRGAASLVQTSPLDEGFALRRRRNAGAKTQIARTAAQLVGPHMSVMLGDGSTALAVAEELRRMESVISVATPALNIAERLAGVESIEVTVLGGMLRGSSFGTVGPLTTAALLSMRADIAFLSPDRLDERGLVFNSMMDAEVAQTMAARADRVVVIADSSKFASGGMAVLTTWDRVDDLITERISPSMSARIQDCDVRVRVTGVVRPRTPR